MHGAQEARQAFMFGLTLTELMILFVFVLALLIGLNVKDIQTLGVAKERLQAAMEQIELTNDSLLARNVSITTQLDSMEEELAAKNSSLEKQKQSNDDLLSKIEDLNRAYQEVVESSELLTRLMNNVSEPERAVFKEFLESTTRTLSQGQSDSALAKAIQMMTRQPEQFILAVNRYEALKKRLDELRQSMETRPDQVQLVQLDEANEQLTERLAELEQQMRALSGINERLSTQQAVAEAMEDPAAVELLSALASMDRHISHQYLNLLRDIAVSAEQAERAYDMLDLMKAVLEEPANTSKAIEEHAWLLASLSDKDQRLTAISQEMQSMESENARLQTLENDYKSLSRRLSDESTRAENAVRQVAYYKRQIRGGRGSEHPPCWITEDGKNEYLFRVTLTPDGFEVVSAWREYRKEQALTIPGVSDVVNQKLSAQEFTRLTRPIYDWAEQRECRHFVKIDDKVGAQKALYKKRLQVAERHFYKYLLN